MFEYDQALIIELIASLALVNFHLSLIDLMKVNEIMEKFVFLAIYQFLKNHFLDISHDIF